MTPLEDAVRILKSGGLVAFPTETVYGLGADALNVKALAKVFEAKNRPTFDPLILHVVDAAGARALAATFPPLAEKLAAAFWPGPLTLVLPKNPNVPDLATSGLPSVALRVPNHPMALDLLRAFGGPLAAPSANPFGGVSPTTADHVTQGLGNKVDLVLDGGPCAVGVESTVLSLLEGVPVLLRPGGTALEDLERVCGKIRVPQEGEAVSQSPGRLEKHYAPRTPLYRAGSLPSYPGRPRLGYLAFRDDPMDGLWERVEVLAPSGEAREAAANLFAALRRLDGAGLQAIAFEPLPEAGLGRAVNDRLRRASQKD